LKYLKLRELFITDLKLNEHIENFMCVKTIRHDVYNVPRILYELL